MLPIGSRVDPAAFKKAVEYFGGPVKMGQTLGRSRFSIYTWNTGLRNMPGFVAHQIEEMTNGFVTRNELLPDYFLKNGNYPKPQKPLKKQLNGGSSVDKTA